MCSPVFVWEPHASLAMGAQVSFEMHSCVHPGRAARGSIFSLAFGAAVTESNTENGGQIKMGGACYIFPLISLWAKDTDCKYQLLEAKQLSDQHRCSRNLLLKADF